jgi:hypothetical protein
MAKGCVGTTQGRKEVVIVFNVILFYLHTMLVIPVETGIECIGLFLDSHLRGNDGEVLYFII